MECIGTEDCLYLDVVAPQIKIRINTCYVWIHGGGNTSALRPIRF